MNSPALRSCRFGPAAGFTLGPIAVLLAAALLAAALLADSARAHDRLLNADRARRDTPSEPSSGLVSTTGLFWATLPGPRARSQPGGRLPWDSDDASVLWDDDTGCDEFGCDRACPPEDCRCDGPETPIQKCPNQKCFDQDSSDQWSFLVAIDGAKQPQDYGVNADLGGRLQTQYSAPICDAYGVGYQIGTAVTWTDNAVRVFELIGEDTSRVQSFTTVGLFQRSGRWAWGGVMDHLYQDGFDVSHLGQCRGRCYYEATPQTHIGLTGQFRLYDDQVQFLGDPVTLRSINQGSLFVRHFFPTGVQSTWWFGMVDEHGESNAVTGPSPARNDSFVLGADFLAPLNDSLALYGETNLIMPADTGTVDALFGMIWYPGGHAGTAHRARFAPLLPVAAPTNFIVDLLP